MHTSMCVAVYTHNPSTWEAEAKEEYRVQGQTQLQNKNLSQNIQSWDLVQWQDAHLVYDTLDPMPSIKNKIKQKFGKVIEVGLLN